MPNKFKTRDYNNQDSRIEDSSILKILLTNSFGEMDSRAFERLELKFR